jgi:hypothetical protein
MQLMAHFAGVAMLAVALAFSAVGAAHAARSGKLV